MNAEHSCAATDGSTAPASGRIMLDQLVWQLADETADELPKEVRYNVFLALGAGEHVSALTQILSVLALPPRKPLTSAIADRLTSWLDLCPGSPEERTIRPLLAACREPSPRA
jgi:hypothetical protein